jgi:hypothetical protein
MGWYIGWRRRLPGGLSFGWYRRLGRRHKAAGGSCGCLLLLLCCGVIAIAGLGGVKVNPTPDVKTITPGVQVSATPQHNATAESPSETPAPALLATAVRFPTPAPTVVHVGALCNDKTSTYNTGLTACARHGGVQCWKMSDGTCVP